MKTGYEVFDGFLVGTVIHVCAEGIQVEFDHGLTVSYDMSAVKAFLEVY